MFNRLILLRHHDGRGTSPFWGLCFLLITVQQISIILQPFTLASVPSKQSFSPHSEQKARSHYCHHYWCHSCPSCSLFKEEVPGKEKNTVPFPFQKLTWLAWQLTCTPEVQVNEQRPPQWTKMRSGMKERTGGQREASKSRRRKQGAPGEKECRAELWRVSGGGVGGGGVLERLFCFPSCRRQRNRLWEKDSGPLVRTIHWAECCRVSLHNTRENRIVARNPNCDLTTHVHVNAFIQLWSEFENFECNRRTLIEPPRKSTGIQISPPCTQLSLTTTRQYLYTCCTASHTSTCS